MLKTQPSQRSAHTSRGFTLIELLVTIAIAAILLALAAPSFKAMVARNTFSSVSGDFKGSLLRARNEATSKNACVTVCRSTNTANDQPSCSTSGTNWQDGWIAFYEDSCDASQVQPMAIPAGGTALAYAPERLILVRQPGNPNYSITPSNSVTTFQFKPLGRTNLAGSRKFTFASTDAGMTTSYGFATCLDMLGSMRNVASASDC